MNRAKPVDIRKALEAADACVKSGVLFVPIPVLDAEDHAELVKLLMARLEIMEKLCLDSSEDPALPPPPPVEIKVLKPY